MNIKTAWIFIGVFRVNFCKDKRVKQTNLNKLALTLISSSAAVINLTALIKLKSKVITYKKNKQTVTHDCSAKNIFYEYL